jgi:hypothetical protein
MTGQPSELEKKIAEGNQRLDKLEKLAAAQEERLDAIEDEIKRVQPQIAAKAKRNRPGEET